MGLSDHIWLWQVMHVSVGGMPAKALVSTDVWQYRQSRAQAANVMLMAERNWLVSRNLYTGGVGRKIEGCYSPHHASKQEDSACDTSSRYGIRSSDEKVEPCVMPP